MGRWGTREREMREREMAKKMLDASCLREFLSQMFFACCCLLLLAYSWRRCFFLSACRRLPVVMIIIICRSDRTVASVSRPLLSSVITLYFVLSCLSLLFLLLWHGKQLSIQQRERNKSSEDLTSRCLSFSLSLSLSLSLYPSFFPLLLT